MFLRQKCQWQRHATVTIVLALATLGDATQIEMILIAKASQEGHNFAGIITYKPHQCKQGFRIFFIFATSPKVAKASTKVSVACHCHWCFCLKNITIGSKAL
jgi:hypothetical protein